MMRKHYFSFILFFVVIHPMVKAQKDSVPRFDNAYYLAKAITSYNQAATSDSMAKMLLSGILWYMEDDRTPDPSQQEIALDKYPVIRKYYDSLLKRFKKDEDIFTIELDVLRLCIQKFNAQDKQQLTDFIELRKEYDELVTDSSSVNSQIRKLWDNRKTYLEYLEYEEINMKRLKLEKVVDSIHLLENTIQRYKGLLTQNRAEYKKLAEDSSNHTVNLKRVRNEIHGLKSFTDKIHLKCLINAGVSASRIYEIASDRGWIEYKESISKREPESDPVEMSPLSFKMPSQSDIIDALAIYLAKRVKQESVMWFFETLQRNVKYNDLVRTFFPETVALLQSNEVYEIPNLGAAWRYSLSKDFVYMPRNLFNSGWFKKKLGSDSTEIATSLVLSWDIARMVEQKYSYNDIIASLYLQTDAFQQDSSLTFIDMISFLYASNNEFLKKGSDGLNWLKYEDLLYMNDEELQAMLSLVDARYRHVFSKMTGLHKKGSFAFNRQDLVQFRRWLGLIFLKVKQVDNLKKQVPVYTKEGLEKFEYSDYNTWKFLQDLIRSLNVNANETNYGGLFEEMDPKLKNIMDALVNVQEVYSLLQQKNFAGAVDIVLQTVNRFIIKENYQFDRQELQSRLAGFKYSMPNDDVAANKYLNALAGKEIGIKTGTIEFSDSTLLAYLLKREDQKAIKIIRNLAGFLNDVAQADNSKSLARVVESYAMPPGSYKKKRNSWKSVDLAAYAGMYTGYERTETNIKGEKNSGWVYGVTAPLGLSFSKTLGKKAAGNYKYAELQNPDLIKIGRNSLWRRSGTTLTVFTSVIDIGAVVSYRFNNQDTILPQKLKWAQVLSPGIHFSLGIKNTPLVFSTGVQYTPELRSFKMDNDQRDAIRFYSGILFDIPLFNLWTKSEVVRMR